ncbi:MAG: hypothetical protein KAI66_14220 [Lentisphaeria bacterium]|nr:hypothetical protein [Lentisphaeria bacterium]
MKYLGYPFPVELPPGEMVRAIETIFLIKNGREVTFFFPKEGKYRIKTDITAVGIHLSSVCPEINVMSPSPENISAARLVCEWESSLLIQGIGSLGDNDGTEMLEKVIRDFPDSAFADHAHFSLAGRYESLSHGEGDKESFRKRSFERYSSVSRRITSLRARAILAQIRLAEKYSHLINAADMHALQREHEALRDAIRSMGFDKRTKLCRKIK